MNQFRCFKLKKFKVVDMECFFVFYCDLVDVKNSVLVFIEKKL